MEEIAPFLSPLQPPGHPSELEMFWGHFWAEAQEQEVELEPAQTLPWLLLGRAKSSAQSFLQEKVILVLRRTRMRGCSRPRPLPSDPQLPRSSHRIFQNITRKKTLIFLITKKQTLIFLIMRKRTPHFTSYQGLRERKPPCSCTWKFWEILCCTWQFWEILAVLGKFWLCCI